MDKYIKNRLSAFCAGVVMEVQERTGVIGDIDADFAHVAGINIISREMQLRELPPISTVSHSNYIYVMLMDMNVSNGYKNFFTDKLIKKIGYFKESFEKMAVMENRLVNEESVNEASVKVIVYGNHKLYNMLLEELNDYPRRGYIQKEEPRNVVHALDYLVENKIISEFTRAYLRENRQTPNNDDLHKYYDYVQDLIKLIHFDTPANIQVKQLEFKKWIITNLYKELEVLLGMNNTNNNSSKMFRSVKSSFDSIDVIVNEKCWNASTPADIELLAYYKDSQNLELITYKNNTENILAKAKNDKLNYLRNKRETIIIRKANYLKRLNIPNSNKESAIKCLLEGKSNKDIVLEFYGDEMVKYFYRARDRYGYAPDEHNKTIEALGFIITHLLYELYK